MAEPDVRLLGRFACRHCGHDQYRHNNIEGCTACRCGATVGEAAPRTDAELDARVRAPEEAPYEAWMRRDYAPPCQETSAAARRRADDLHRYDEAAAKLRDPERYEALRQLTFDQRHPCPIDGCGLSAEEHHRLSYGVLSELAALRRRVADLEAGRAEVAP